MPEGDTVARAAARIRPVLVGQLLADVGGTAPSIRRHQARLRRRHVHDVRTVGKHLVIDVQGGWSVNVHLGMSGSWVVRKGGGVPGRARLVLSTARGTVACLDAPTVEVDRTPTIDRALGALGPDVLADDFDPAEVARRAASRADRPVTDVLLDQRVMAGVGNEYKAELLFRLRWHPRRPAASVTGDEWKAAAELAARLVGANVDRATRSTTGDRTPGRETWVYGRAGKPCRRCGTRIEEAWLGSPARVTAWCPSCQAD
ncbi:MAG: DNA-formamidopyrimidine glycosylase family protein [Acidimicrobiia bacterium]